MSFECLEITQDARGVAYVRLNIPRKRNALSSQAITELTEMATSLGAALETRAIVLSGAGDVFCAGADLTWMKAQVEANRETRVAEARRLAEMLGALNEMPTPLIGRIQGGAFGGGVGLASVCDIVIAEDGAVFSLSETRLGLIPATISPYVMARIGEGCARQIFMSARRFDAVEAQRLGLVARVAAGGDLDTAVEAEVAPYLSVAPGAVGAAKALARALGPRIDDEVVEDTVQRLADIWETEEARHGIAAFLEKTPPRWMQSAIGSKG
ncbi:MAG: crotonase/enoyl-CoA hydratase family protein [Pseudomonadota bacterium]